MDENKSELNLLQRLDNFRQEDIEINKSKAAYGYKYAPLDVILPVIEPLLKQHGIGYVHYTDSDERGDYLITRLYNYDDTDDCVISKTLIDGSVILAKMNKFMVIGSAMTYFRRYHLVVMLGLLTDEDTDAGGAKPSSGRSVEAAGLKEGQVNYIDIFKNLIAKGKQETMVRKSFDVHKKKMTPDVLKEIESLIVTSFKVKK